MLILIPTLVFWIVNPNLGKLGPKKSKLTENWHTWHLGSADSESALRFWNSNPKIHFWANLEFQKSKCGFLKIFANLQKSKLSVFPENWHAKHLDDANSYYNISFWISDPKSIFGQIWAKKVNVVCFAWKLVHMLSRNCWFLFQH